MGTKDQNIDPPQKPRDVELTNDSLLNGENEEARPAANRGGQSGSTGPSAGSPGGRSGSS